MPTRFRQGPSFLSDNANMSVIYAYTPDMSSITKKSKILSLIDHALGAEYGRSRPKKLVF